VLREIETLAQAARPIFSSGCVDVQHFHPVFEYGWRTRPGFLRRPSAAEPQPNEEKDDFSQRRKSRKERKRLDSFLVHTYNVNMNAIRFAWDENKNRENTRKHGISFEEAQTVFFDENAIRYFDPDHSEDEDRFIMLGISFKLRVLVVCHCYRVRDTTIRIVSARKANKRETQAYGR
jgi:hypothetical protein